MGDIWKQGEKSKFLLFNRFHKWTILVASTGCKIEKQFANTKEVLISLEEPAVQGGEYTKRNCKNDIFCRWINLLRFWEYTENTQRRIAKIFWDLHKALIESFMHNMWTTKENCLIRFILTSKSLNKML